MPVNPHTQRSDPVAALARTGHPRWLAPASTAVVTAVLVLWLPFHVPVTYRPILSASYMAGCNNAVSVLLAAGISMAVLLLTLWFHRDEPAQRFRDAADEKLSQGFVLGVVAGLALAMAIGATLVARSHMRYLADAGYFIEQATARHDTGNALYTQIEFAYGPLLLLPAIWVSNLLRCSITTGYYITLVANSAIGLALLAYSLNQLPIRGALRRSGLVLFAIGAVTPFLGNNYTFLRFATPMAMVLFATRQRSPWRCAAILAVGQVLCLLISPELGIATLATLFFFAALRTSQADWRWLASAVLPMGAAALLFLALGPSSLGAFSSFTKGALNLPVGPYPHIAILLCALVWLVPVGLGRMVRLRDPESARMLTIYVLAVSYIPAALGRCDALHVFFNGTVLFVMALVAVSPASHGMRRAWIYAFALFIAWEHFANDRLWDHRTAQVLKLTVMPHIPQAVRDPPLNALERRARLVSNALRPGTRVDPKLDATTLDLLVGPEGVATPLEIRTSSEEVLRQTHRYRPPYRAFWVGLVSPADEARSIAELNRNRFALLPGEWIGQFVETPLTIEYIEGIRLPYRQRHDLPYDPGPLFRENMREHWTPIARIGPEVLYRRNEQASSSLR